jgi:Pyridoxamine 5'-phosphate oxidase
VLTPETVSFLEGGCSCAVATVDAANEPYGTRGWGVTFVAGDDVRLVLDAADRGAMEDLAATARIAVTAADVLTLRSIQFKGVARSVEPATDGDRERVARYCDAFFGNIVAIDGTPRTLLDRLVPTDFVACTVRVEELYDQTPGPAAGASMPEQPS